MAKELKQKYYKTLNKARTPIFMLNSILGGGISFGRLVNAFGKNQSGKSTFCLQAAQYFLEDYGDNCRVVILDSEANYADASRLENAFKISPHNGEVEVINPDPRVFLHFNATIEGTFNTCIKYVNESRELNIPTLIIIDSLSTLVPSRDMEELEKALSAGGMENTFAGGMMLAPRIMGQKVSHLLGALPSSLAVVLTVSQATADMEASSAYAGPQIKAKNPGYSLGHAFHLQLKFSILPSSLKANPNDKSDAAKANKNYIDKNMQDDENTRKTTLTNIQITKNKISVCEEDITLMINNINGGRFIEQFEIFESLSVAKGLLASNGGRFYLRDDLKEKYAGRMLTYIDYSGDETVEKQKDLNVSWLKKEIVTSAEFFQLLKDEIVLYYRDNVSSVDSIYQQMEHFKTAKGL